LKINMQKILILNFEFPPVGGGGGVATYQLAKGFIRKGYEVDVVTGGYKGLPSFEIKDKINIYRVKVFFRRSKEVSNFFSMLSFLFSGFLKCLHLCKKNNYLFINTHFVLPTGPLGFVLSKIFKLKNIVSIHGGDIYDPTLKRSPHRNFILRNIVSFMLDSSFAVIAQSSDTKNNCDKYYKLKNKISIVPLPYDIFDFKEARREDLGMKKDLKYAITVGRLVKRKGIDYLLRAVKKIDYLNAIIIGDGPEKEKWIKFSKELKINDRVKFLGRVDENKKFQYLNNSDVYVLSSLHEGLGIVLQEAMQVGLPIVSFDNGGQIDLVENEENGFLVKIGDVDGMADKIEIVVNNKKIAEKFRINNLIKIKRFNLNRIADLYLEILNK